MALLPILISIIISSFRVSSSAPASTDFIRTCCSRTTYPDLCYSSLASHASTIGRSPRLLARTALNVTLAKAQTTSSVMVKLSRAHGLKPREISAMADCVEELGDTVYELRRSIAEMDAPPSSKKFELMISNVKTWVSAALTDENTCSDGFAGSVMNGSLKTVVRKQIESVAQLTSNALALVNYYASLHGYMN